MGEEETGGRRGERFIGERRAHFFAVLRETGNARTAAAAIGMDRRTLERRRQREPDVDREWTAALDAADARLARLRDGFGPAGGEQPFETIQRGADGRLRLIAAGKGRWCARVEANFLAELRRSGNVSAAARAVGFSGNHVWERRRSFPGFARRWEEALEDAEIELEFRLTVAANNVAGEPGAGGEQAGGAQPPFDPEFALKFLKWRDEKRAGRGRRGRGDVGPREPTIAEVKEHMLKRIEAIERHRKRKGEAPPG